MTIKVVRNGVVRTLTAAEAEAFEAERPAQLTFRREVSKLVIVDRLIAAGKAEAALAALAADPVAKLRWDAATAIYSDDPGAIALLTAAGADPEAILAP